MALTREDLQAIGALLEPINNRLDALEETIEVVKRSQLNVELIELPRIAAALDGYDASKDRDEQLGERITFLEKKAEIHDARLFSLEQAKVK